MTDAYNFFGYQTVEVAGLARAAAPRQEINGTDGNDTLTGGGEDDQIRGFGGRDTLLGRGGSDDLIGDAGRDELNGGAGSDTLDGGKGDDTLFGRSGRDTLTDGEGNDVMNGGKGNDTFFVDIGFDTVNGGQGSDTWVDDLEGFSASFTLVMDFTTGEHFVLEEPDSQNDTFTSIENYALRNTDIAVVVTGDRKANDIETDQGDDIVTSGNGNDDVDTGRGNDDIQGGGGADTLIAGRGSDVIEGGKGADTLSGGPGSDIFVFTADKSGADVIVDFEADKDTLRIELRDLTEEDVEVSFRAIGTTVTFGDAEVLLQDVFLDKDDITFEYV